jgi:transposase
MAKPPANPCPGCIERDREIADLRRRLAALEKQLAKLAALQKRVDELEAELAKAKKNSRNSSKPPSSDIVNPKKRKEQPDQAKNGKIGGQPGHRRHERTAVPEDQVDHHWEWRYEACPCCGGGLEEVGESRVHQQIELSEISTTVEQHDVVRQRCAHCEKVFSPQIPDDLRRAGLFGPRLTALVGFLKGACHMSFSAIRKYFRDVIGVQVSRGMLSKLVQKVSDSLQEPYEALVAMLRQEEVLNVDETGHKENGKRMWTWCFRAYLFTVYKISPSRGSDVLLDVLGEEFDGVLGCDYFSAYRKYMRLNENVLVQFCLAHFIRDVKFLVEHPNRKNRAYGKRLVDDLRKLFDVIHRREEYPSQTAFRRALEAARNDLVWDATMESPGTREAAALEERFYLHTDSYFRFITEANVEPTNNLAEQAIRFVAIHRRITQGTRSERGREWCARMWTVMQTCSQQDRSVFHFLCAAVEAYFKSQPAPSLAPDSS